jgi:hypothetical protein
MVKPYISTFHPTKVSQPGLERGNPGLSFRVVLREVHEDANSPQAFVLLRARRQGPSSRRAAK